MSMLVSKERTVFVGDVNIHENPSETQIADIAFGIARTVKKLGYMPRVALLSFSNFGNPSNLKSEIIRKAVEILANRKVSFEFDGEMSAETALDYDLIKENYRCRLSGPANVLIMPDLTSANISLNYFKKWVEVLFLVL